MPNPLYDALFAPLATRDTRFLILPDGSEMAGKSFHMIIARTANALRAAGVVPGDRVVRSAFQPSSAIRRRVGGEPVY